MEAAQRQLTPDTLNDIKNAIAKKAYGTVQGGSFSKGVGGLQHIFGGPALGLMSAPVSVPWNLLKAGKQVLPASAWTLLNKSQ